MGRVMVFSFAAMLIGGFLLNLTLDGTAYWIALAVLGFLVGLSLRWVAPDQVRRRGTGAASDEAVTGR
jgi:hypothetical protein